MDGEGGNFLGTGFLCFQNAPLGKVYFYFPPGYSEVERYKLERKRERNRIAATKCRYYLSPIH